MIFFRTKTLRTIVRVRRSFTIVLPWISLACGIASGAMISRQYDNSSLVLGYSFAFMALSVVVVAGLSWLEILRDTASRAGRFALNYATQSSFQYVTMFTLPFLFLSRSYLTLSLTLVTLTTTLWDDWWAKFHPSIVYRCLLRSLCGGLGLAFGLAVVKPHWIDHFYVITWTAMGLLALPFEGLFHAVKLRPRHWLPAASIAILVVTGLASSRWMPFPLLSHWLSHPAFGIEASSAGLGTTWSSPVSLIDLKKTVQEGEGICCFTPVVAPRGTQDEVSHEWFVDQELVDRIALGQLATSAANEDPAHPFRTYSCKHYFPGLDQAKSLGCRAVIGNRVVVGSLTLKIAR